VKGYKQWLNESVQGVKELPEGDWIYFFAAVDD